MCVHSAHNHGHHDHGDELALARLDQTAEQLNQSARKSVDSLCTFESQFATISIGQGSGYGTHSVPPREWNRNGRTNVEHFVNK